MSEERDSLIPLTSLPASQGTGAETSRHEEDKIRLSNKLLEGQIERNRQKKIQRGWIFGVGVSFCCLFYIIFCIITSYIYYNFLEFPAMPVAWVFPLIGLLTVPTLFLAVMVLCLYRDRPEINPDTMAKALWKIISNLPK